MIVKFEMKFSKVFSFKFKFILVKLFHYNSGLYSATYMNRMFWLFLWFCLHILLYILMGSSTTCCDHVFDDSHTFTYTRITAWCWTYYSRRTYWLCYFCHLNITICNFYFLSKTKIDFKIIKKIKFQRSPN